MGKLSEVWSGMKIPTAIILPSRAPVALFCCRQAGLSNGHTSTPTERETEVSAGSFHRLVGIGSRNEPSSMGRIDSPV